MGTYQMIIERLYEMHSKALCVNYSYNGKIYKFGLFDEDFRGENPDYHGETPPQIPENLLEKIK